MSFPVITKTKKKEITAKWHEVFPEMGVYKPMWLMNTLGPLAVGLCLEVQSNRDTYYPKLHLHNLLKEQEDIYFQMIIEKPTYSITTVSKEEKINRIMNELKNNIFIPTEGDVKYCDLVEKMKRYCWQTNASYQLTVLRVLLYLARWTGSQKEENDILRFCEEIWNQEKLAFIAEKKDKWMTEKVSEIGDTDTIRQIAIQEKEKFGLNSLPHRELIFP